MTKLEDLRARLSSAGLGNAAENILKMVRPCYRIERTLTTEDNLSIGTSRFGGSPDVPDGFEWPICGGGKNPEAMEFVGQLRLKDLPAGVSEPLPRDGLLSFFTRWSESRVFFYPEGTSLTRALSPNPPVAAPPSGFFKSLFAELKRNPDPHKTYRPCALTFVPALSLPDGSSSLIEDLQLSHADAESYMESVLDHPVTQHQMFGYATPVQNEMELECDYVRKGQEMRWDSSRDRFISATHDWILLLQIDTDDYPEGPGWMWGDAGMVYFWIHRDDLVSGFFDKVICIEQCH